MRKPRHLAVFAAFHGGANYTPEHIGTRFDTLTDVKAEWERRKRDGFYPCWGQPSYGTALGEGFFHHAAYVWFIDPSTDRLEDDGTLDTTDLYPDRELVYGPRGGLSWRNC